MAILVSEDTRLVVQGITGREGTFHTLRNRDYGTQVVAGVTPGKGGTDVDGIPVFDTVADAVRETGANTAMVFVPPRFAADAIYESADAGVELIVCIAEGIPAHEMLDVYTYLRPRGIRLLGPNCPGALSPGRANVGIIPAQVFAQGGVGLVSRSGTLTYQIGAELAQLGLGNSTIVGIGGDPVVGTSFIDALELFQADDQTEIIVMVGEIGGNEEEKAADYIAEHVTKPVFSYIAGFTAPPGKTMGHAGAIISGSAGTAAAKKEALEARGVQVGTNPTEVAQLVAAGASAARWRVISFARGVPSPDLLPVAELASAAQRALEQDPAGALAYGDGAGYPPLRQWIASRYGDGDAGRVLCTNGSLQGLAFLAEALFAGSGGRAIVEAPTYDRAILILRRFGATVEAVDLHADGLDVDAIEAACEAGRVPGLVYTIPNFQNPGGVTLSLAKRERLVALARAHGFLVLEDDPYGELRFDGTDEPRLFALDEGAGNVIYSTSFTKTVAPGHPHRCDGAAAGAARHHAPARDRHLHRPDDAVRGDRRRVLRGRQLRARRRAHAGRAARAPRRAGGRARPPLRRPRGLRRARRRLLPVGEPAGRRRRRAGRRGRRRGRSRRQGFDVLHRRPRPRRAAARLLRLPRSRHGRGRGAPRSPAVGSGFSSRRTTYGEVVPSKPPDDSRQPDELQELLTLLGAAAQLAGCWLYVEDRFGDGTVRSAYDAPGFGALFGDPDLEEIAWRDHVLAEDEAILNGLATVVPGDSFDVHYRLRGVDGVVRVVRDRGRVHLTPAGAVRVWGTVQDITAEQEMRETVRRIGETIDEYYFTDELRPDGTYEPHLRHRRRSTACSAASPTGMTYGEAWHAAVHPDDRALAGVAGRTACAPASRSTSSTAWSASTASRGGSGCAARCARRSPTGRASSTASRRT